MNLQLISEKAGGSGGEEAVLTGIKTLYTFAFTIKTHTFSTSSDASHLNFWSNFLSHYVSKAGKAELTKA